MDQRTNGRSSVFNKAVIQWSQMYSELKQTWPFEFVRTLSCSLLGLRDFHNTDASIGQVTFLSRMLMKRNLWRGASPAPAWLGLNQSLCSRASKRWKPLWAGQDREKSIMNQSQTARHVKSFHTDSRLLSSALYPTVGLQSMDSTTTWDQPLTCNYFDLYIYWGTAQWIFISSNAQVTQCFGSKMGESFTYFRYNINAGLEIL